MAQRFIARINIILRPATATRLWPCIPLHSHSTYIFIHLTLIWDAKMTVWELDSKQHGAEILLDFFTRHCFVFAGMREQGYLDLRLGHFWSCQNNCSRGVMDFGILSWPREMTKGCRLGNGRHIWVAWIYICLVRYKSYFHNRKKNYFFWTIN